MFDFTQQVPLDAKKLKTYKKFQKLLYLASAIAAVYFAYLILFPSAYFSFDFSNPNSQKNTVISPRDSRNQYAEHGNISTGNKIIFDTALVGSYEKAKVEFIMDKKSESPENLKLEARKSYQAFLYPDGNPIFYKDGALINMKGEYYISYGGLLKYFDEEDAPMLEKMGYDRQTFIPVTAQDIKNIDETDDPVESISAYPDGTLFKIDEDYYQLIDGSLEKFLSQNAFLSQYNENMAIAKKSDFLKKYAISEKIIGFSDGTLLSYGISAYIVSSGKLLPINNTVTFTAMGYGWNDVKQASADEISFYEKDKLFTISSPHPNGTVLLTSETGRGYLVENSAKRLMATDSILKSWQKNKPIEVSQKSLETFENCQLKKETLSLRTYSCDIPLSKFSDLIGKDYEFVLNLDKQVQIDSISIIFKKQASWPNFKATVNDLLNKIKGNYGIGTTQ
jgi:hypothetical protein